jgi:hypothetical protein
MTATLDGVTKKEPAEQSAEQQAAAELVRTAKEQGLFADGPGWAAQAADENGARDCSERRDDRAPGL